MVRAFETHKIRKTRELSGSLWDFQTLPEEGDAVRLKTPVPGCWQSEPETLTYRGKACYERKFSASGNIRLEFKGSAIQHRSMWTIKWQWSITTHTRRSLRW